MKKIIMIVIVVAMTFSSVIVSAESGLTDIEKHWAKANIEKLVGLGIINGYPDGTFKPDNNINVDAFIKLTITALGYTDIKNGSPYWATHYINKAIALNLIGEGEFNAYTRPITREEMSSVVSKALEQLQEIEDIDKKSAFIGYTIADDKSISGKYKKDVHKSYYYGLMTGKPEGFDPIGHARRAEAATVVLRLIDEAYRKPVSIPPVITMEDVEKDDKGYYFDVVRYWNYKRNNTTEKYDLGRAYKSVDGEDMAIQLMYAMNKVYQDNEGYTFVKQSGYEEKPIGVNYSCLDDISSTVDGTTTPIVSIIANTEVVMGIKNSKHNTYSAYGFSMFYKKRNMSYMERFYKYEKMFDTMLMYLYEEQYIVVKDKLMQIYEIAENMESRSYWFTLRLNNREMFVQMDQCHSVRIAITVQGGTVEHFYPVKEEEPKWIR